MGAETVPLQAGVARAQLTPPIGAILVGYPDPNRRATAERDPLYATALVVDDGHTRVAVVSCDLAYIHPAVARDVRAMVQERTGIAPAQVLICCSHTHSGPAVYDHPGAQTIDRVYVSNLRFILAGTIVAAAAHLQPVQLRWGVSRSGIGINRREMRPDGRVVLGRNPDGPVDPVVRVACLTLPDDRPLALLVNYACHPVALGGSSTAISADYVGHMRAVVEQATGGSVLFIQGACADINPRLGPGSDTGQVATLGLELAGAVLTAHATVTPLEATPGVGAVAARLDLPLMEDTSIIPDLISDEERREHCQGIDQWEPWAADLVTDAGGQRATPIEMQALRIGELTMVAIPAEPFVEIGLALQQMRPDRPTMVAGYTNGCVGYIPMPNAYLLGGYEVARSFVYPRLPAPLAPTCAEHIIAEGALLLKSLTEEMH